MWHPQSSQITEILFAKRKEVGSDFLAVCCSDKPNPICVLSILECSSTKFCSLNALLAKHLESAAYSGVKTIYFTMVLKMSRTGWEALRYHSNKHQATLVLYSEQGWVKQATH